MLSGGRTSVRMNKGELFYGRASYSGSDERYDGKGYPDGLKGEEIPISAQVVSLADVYDALVSDRVYKKAYSHEKAMEMILNGECGMFNPLLLECLVEIQDKVRKELDIKDVNECLEYLEERNR